MRDALARMRSDVRAQELVDVLASRVQSTLQTLRTESALAAFAVWVANDDEDFLPPALSVCSAERWAKLLPDEGVEPSYEEVAHLFAPLEWDAPEVDIVAESSTTRVDTLGREMYARYGEAGEPARAVLNETTRRVAGSGSAMWTSEVVAFATDLDHSDQVLESIRYATPAKGKEYLLRRGLLPDSLSDLP